MGGVSLGKCTWTTTFSKDLIPDSLDMWTHILSRIKEDSRRAERKEDSSALISIPPWLPSKLLVVPDGPSPPSTPPVLPVVPVFGVKVVGVVVLVLVGVLLVLVGVLEVPAALVQGKRVEEKQCLDHNNLNKKEKTIFVVLRWHFFCSLVPHITHG